MAKSEYPRTAFAVRLDAALRVKPFISKEETRYYLNGLYVEALPNGGAVCVATDGHRMGIRNARDGVCYHPAIVSLPPEIKMPKGMLASPWLVCTLTAPGKGFVSIVEAATKKDEEDTAEAAIRRIDDCVLRVGRAVIDGTFPDWRRVVPKVGKDDTVRGFNGEYLKTFGRYVTMRGGDESSPHLVRIDDDPEFLGILMPRRTKDRLDKLPDWLAPAAAPVKKAA